MQALILFNISVHFMYLTGKINLTVLSVLTPKGLPSKYIRKNGTEISHP